MSRPVAPVNLARLHALFRGLEQQKVRYLLGGKAEVGAGNPRAHQGLWSAPAAIDALDCSGAVRYLLFQASGGALLLPDGSQMQRAWCEEHAQSGALHQLAHYSDANRYGTARRLFLAFIVPHCHGCGPVGHVWLVARPDENAAAVTRESHGGVGIGSRRWDSPTLLHQVYSCYELPTLPAGEAA
jgi:hypothetical protein